MKTITALGTSVTLALLATLMFNAPARADMISGAFEKYVAKDWCDYGHLINQMKKLCGSFNEAIAFFSRFTGKPLADTEMIEFPLMSSVNGPMVTMYGTGVDVFEVRHGKIVAHYDASPMKGITLKDKLPEHLPPWVPGSSRGTGTPVGTR
jgi:hypothetical protein